MRSFKPARLAVVGSPAASGNLRSFSAIAFLPHGFVRPIRDGAAQIGLESEEMGEKLFDRRWFDSRPHGRHDPLTEPPHSVQHRPCGTCQIDPFAAPRLTSGTTLSETH